MENRDGEAASGHDEVPAVRPALRHCARLAIVDREGPLRYGNLLDHSRQVAAALLRGRQNLDGARVVLRLEPGSGFAAALWGVWRAGGVAVPIGTSWPRPEIDRTLADCDPAAAVADEPHFEALRDIAADRHLRLLRLDELPAYDESSPLPVVKAGRPALMVYTSGTTGRPKGVVTTHTCVGAQIDALVRAWGWRPDDRILNVLPLHHVHGLINALACPLSVGATCEFSAFDPELVWERLASGEVTVFMAVPTIYGRLLDTWEASRPERRRAWTRGVSTLRLMVSGSAALPSDVFERWHGATGQRLLERYGMTEIGMALSNPLDGERRPGTVGQPLPGVEARLVGEQGRPVGEGDAGEIEVRGPQLFREYWRRPEETAAAFRDGWFRTGDTARIDEGYWRILGRTSVDIIKSGGYKVSALEVESVLRHEDSVADVAVVGVPDPRWGERLCAAVIATPGSRLDPEGLRAWCRERLAPYKVPRTFRVVEELPRNAMGKVQKPVVQGWFSIAVEDG